MKDRHTGCLDDEIIMGYLERLLSGDESSSVEEHLMKCDKCLKEAISLNRIVLKMSRSENVPIPEVLMEKAIAANRRINKAKYFSEFIISLAEKAVSLVNTVLLPEAATLKVFSTESPAFAFREKAISGNILNIDQKIKEIDIRIQFFNTEGPAASLRVLFLKQNLPLAKERISLYRNERLLSSRVTAEGGNVMFPDITYGYYRIVVPQEDIEMAFKVLPPEQ